MIHRLVNKYIEQKILGKFLHLVRSNHQTIQVILLNDLLIKNHILHVGNEVKYFDVFWLEQFKTSE